LLGAGESPGLDKTKKEETEIKMKKVENALFGCAFGLGIALVVIMMVAGMPNWIVGLVIPYVATGTCFVGMRLKSLQI
jgi:hypothetical protein